MGLALRTQRNGALRGDWYGEYRDADGKRKVINLNIPWKGTPPASGHLSDPGDELFERSRERADAELSRFVDEARRKGKAETLTERLIESKTGTSVEYVRIEDLLDRWLALPRSGELSKGYVSMCNAIMGRFVHFMNKRNSKALYLYQVKKSDVEAFAKFIQSKLSPKTYREHLRLLRPAFDRFLPPGMTNHFRTAFLNAKAMGTTKDTHSVHRKPFTADELRILLDTALTDEFMYPLIVCAAMTGMRRGDVCRLKWEAVDLRDNMLTVKTSKTGASIEIPIFPMLRDVLIAAGGKGKGFVFPDAAKMLKDNPDGLTWRFKKIVARAFKADEAPPQNLVPAAEILDEGTEAIREHIADPVRQARMLDVLKRYAEGQSVRVMEKDTGIARATISNDLRTVETWTGHRFVRSRAGGPGIKSQVNEVTRIAREHGQRAASVRDWHALRVTWITFALAAGVPMELVRRVTGHATVDVVLKHYFRPGREQFRAALANALPDVLTGERAKRLSVADELAELAGKVQSGNATSADKKRLRLLAAKV